MPGRLFENLHYFDSFQIMLVSFCPILVPFVHFKPNTPPSISTNIGHDFIEKANENEENIMDREAKKVSHLPGICCCFCGTSENSGERDKKMQKLGFLCALYQFYEAPAAKFYLDIVCRR